MRGAWWKIARLEIGLALRDRESLLWSLVAPIAMAWIFGTMFDSKPPAPTQVVIDAGLNPPVVREVVAGEFGRRGFVVGDEGIRVVLPDSLLDRMASGRDVVARVIQGEAGDTRTQSVSACAREAMYRMVFRVAELQRLSAGDSAAGASRLLAASGPLVVAARPLGTAPKLVTGKERTLPAMLIMFIMFQVMTFFLSLWVDDLKTGKIKRIVMSPTRPRDLLLGQLAARLAWAGLQVVVILGLGSLVMGVRLHVPWLDFALVLFAFMLTAASIGMMIGSFFKSSEKAGAVGVIASLVMAALGGCWWPLEIVPGPMRAVALALPTGQAMDAVGEMLALGPAAPFPAANLVVLMLMALVTMPVAVRRMRSQLMG
jgi:ABC-type multidrug transport system permease subunit